MLHYSYKGREEDGVVKYISHTTLEQPKERTWTLRTRAALLLKVFSLHFV